MIVETCKEKILTWIQINMNYQVDHSIVESFSEGGRTCITSRVYPTKVMYDNAKTFLFNNASEANITASLNIWQMNAGALIFPFCKFNDVNQIILSIEMVSFYFRVYFDMDFTSIYNLYRKNEECWIKILRK